MKPRRINVIGNLYKNKEDKGVIIGLLVDHLERLSLNSYLYLYKKEQKENYFAELLGHMVSAFVLYSYKENKILIRPTNYYLGLVNRKGFVILDEKLNEEDRKVLVVKGKMQGYEIQDLDSLKGYINTLVKSPLIERKFDGYLKDYYDNYANLVTFEQYMLGDKDEFRGL